jgi:hypothetical protein
MPGRHGDDRRPRLTPRLFAAFSASYRTFTEDRALKLSHRAQHRQNKYGAWMLSDFPTSLGPEIAQCLPNRRTTPANIGGLFEGIRHLQRPPIVVVSPDDLDADGQPRLRKSTRNGNRRVPDHRDVIG